MNTNFMRFLFLLVISSFLIYGTTNLVRADELSTAQADRVLLENELANLELQIAVKQKELNNQKGQSVSLSRDIAILNTQINKAKLNIQAKTLTIKKLGGEIIQKNNTIQKLTSKIEQEKQSLAQLVRKSRETDDMSYIVMLLSEETISEAYSDMQAFSSFRESINDSVNEIKGTRQETEVQKKSLEDKKDQETDAKMKLESEKLKVEKNQKERQTLLSISKNKEVEYQKVISEQQKRVGEIKARLFKFAGGTQAIRFDAALGYAEAASAHTNVDPAFILAIITQESNLGSNVGKCYLTDETKGSGVNINTGKTWPNLMKPSRDVKPFMDIANRLGFNPFKTVVSCPIASAGGYGGAMGPAQFIPSTWKMFESRISSIIGGSANPWAPRDAFTASALYLGDLGAKGDNNALQIKAACKYYGSGGSTCAYGRSVMKLKASIQNDIDYLKQYGVSKR